MEFAMSTGNTPTGKAKATVILPQVKKPNLAEIRKGPNGFGQNKPQQTFKSSIRRSGPRGG